ncbi:polymorphic toxin type 28 domain-containing protein [Bradyrhizobium sp. AZCC 1678]|uniref:polymorphic toxin type 28 domain-containing protein n=1 Tax=Bradyrhizobium sp. AZCC 1678 TaxID=3117030 RepID=UPI002FF19C37
MKKLAQYAGAMALAAVWSGAALAQSSGTRSSGFGYDPASGLLTQEVVEPGTPTMRLQTDYVYDAYGNKTSATVSGIDIVTRAASTTYDAQGRFATSATNALGQSETWQYDPRFGQPTSHTGPNGLTTTWSYDGFGRKILEVRADGTRSQFTYSFCSGFNGGTASCPAGAVRLNQANSFAADGTTQNAPTVIVYFDSLEREVARDTQGFDGSIVRGAKQYDSQGRVLKVSRPYFVNGGTPQWTTYTTYDALGRATLVTMPDNSTVQNAYHGLTTTETNAKNQTRTVTKNSAGDVVSVTDAAGNTMLYAYNAFGKLIQTTDAETNIVTPTYDTRGRKIASSDPNLGSWTYTYNVLGELTSQTDAKLQTATISYDKLGRPLQRVEPDMTSVWVYDTAANGIGKVASASITAGPTAGYQRTMTYDALGRPSQAATTIDGTTYTMGAGYDANGRLSQVTYPSGFVASYGYNSLGYANQLSDGSAQTFWTANGIDAEQHLTQQTSGNGIVTTRTFSATTGRLQSIAAGAGNSVQSSAYTYDLLGNPLSRTDDTQNLSESFTYDPLNRLLTATVSGSVAPAKAYTYNSIGNMMSKSEVGTYSYAPPGSPLPHAVMSISGSTISTTFSYDPNGNQTAGLGRTITWTSYNMPATITQGTRTVSFQHNTEHQRIKQVAPDGTTLYIHAFGVTAELFGVGSAAPRWNEYLSVGNVRVGMRVKEVTTTTVSLRYFHTDHLGSISVITNESGVVVERLSYDAWGKRRHPNGADDPTGSITSQTSRGFTGHEELDSVGLVHMNGRVYDALVGRMISPDPTVPDPMNAQAWNRYSYVGNDPLAFTDPSGFSWLSSFFNSVANFFTQNWRSIVQTVITAVLSLPLGPVLAAAAGAAIVTGLSGGNLGQIVRAASIAAITAGAFQGLGNFVGDLAQQGISQSGQYLANVAGSAMIGCLSAAASGGSCKSGGLAAGVTAAASPLVGRIPGGPGRLAASSIVGGLASVAGGGKFENGAVTGAFQYMFGPQSRSSRGTASSSDPNDAYAQYPRNGGPPLDDDPNPNPGTVRVPIPLWVWALAALANQYPDLLQSPQGVDRYKSILDDTHLTAALRELNGEVVARKWDGTPYDHVTEVREAQQGLLNYIGSVNNRLSYPGTSQLERSFLETELGNASRLLDHSKKFVP